MISRREWLRLSVGAGATLALTPELLRALAQSGGKLIQRAIPASGEMLPVIGLSFSNHVSCADPAALREVFRTFVDNGGRVFDAMHGNAASEQFHATVANELGVQNKLFWSTRGIVPGGPGGPPQPGAATVNAHIDTWLARTKAPKMDLVMLPVAGDSTWLAALKEEKKAGRVRYIGVQTISVKFQSAQLETIMRNEPIDFIGVDYDVSNRHVEDTILPLALERKIGVMAFFPFSNNAGTSCSAMNRNLFARVGNTPLPEWAAEFDAKTWAQYFLKYVVSHPAVTVARVGTTKAHHMLDNVGGGIGRLPNEATRKRMAAFIDALPALPPLPQNPAQAPGIALPAAVLDRYVGEYKAASGFTATFRRDGDRLFVKPGTNPEVPLNARSETRFQDPRGPIFEFQLDGQGKVSGAILEQQGPQGPQRTPLERK
ncbi:MAG: putative aldo/keto reductase [Geminicoccaceae bacterium]|jgi:aryl-alcohol dehydrogenase-like predicted oxidoreductase|nr:putative aldo/keto reductase [Geminicoccaceae bacterium]